MCPERDGLLRLSGNRHEVHFSSFTFEVCLWSLEQLLERLSAACRPLSPETLNPESMTMVYWKWTELRYEVDELKSEEEIFKHEARIGQLKLGSMHYVIPALVRIFVCLW